MLQSIISKVDDQFHRLANASVGMFDRFGRYIGFSKDPVWQTEGTVTISQDTTETVAISLLLAVTSSALHPPNYRMER